MVRSRHVKIVVVAEVCYAIFATVFFVATAPGWGLFFAALPLAFPLKWIGVPTPGFYLVETPPGRFALFLFYGAIVALLARAFASLVPPPRRRD